MKDKTIFKYNDVVEVTMWHGVNMAYSYLVPEHLQLEIGDIVEVPLLKRKIHGIISGVGDLNFNTQKLKYLYQKVPNFPGLSKEMMDFMKWCARYNMVSLGSLLKVVMPIPELLKKDDFSKTYTLNKKQLSSQVIKLTAKRKALLDLLSIKALTANELKNTHQISDNIIKPLVEAGFITITEDFKSLDSFQKNLAFKPISLNSSQQSAVDKLLATWEENKFSVSLLDGIPGSGKTEVYFAVIDKVLQEGKEILILLPEIALSTQWLERFKSRFNVNPYIWHSEISNKQKRETYLHLLHKKVKVMVGTRSSLFLPFNNLGLIIIDEEHDSSYKQEEKFIYNARDMAIVKAKINNIPVLLATATPSVETWYNVKQGKYNYLQLENRYNEAPMPEVTLVDMVKVRLPKNHYLSPELIAALKHNLTQKEQSLLFINRRGYAPLLLCNSCGSKILCPNCSAGSHEEVTSEISLIEHKARASLICHQCGYREKPSNKCKICGEDNTIISYGAGVERVAEEVSTYFNEARVAVISSDVLNTAAKMKALIDKIMNREVDILVGTQLIAKGYHFPYLSLVGIVDAALGINGIDLKANERAWQILYQVMGRAGREKTKGRVIMQTFDTDSPLIKSLVEGNRDKFLELELQDRELNNMPPFSKLAAIIVSSEHEKKLIDFVNFLSTNISKNHKELIKGPIPALLYKINKRFRYRFLINVPKKIMVQKLIKEWLFNIDVPNAINIKIDVDPISFY